MTLLGEDGLSKDSVDEDKCRLMKDSVLQGFKDFCTSRGGCLHEALFGHVKQVIVAWASDRCPAVMKAARMLREDCPNLEFVYKDPCHVLRTVAGLVQTAFERSEAVLFEDKGSVIPSVMNSHEWQDKFVWLQKLVLDKDHGRFAGALKVAVRHFDFVRPRWESTACPRRRMAHLVVPTALVLAVTAADQRTDSATKRRRKGYPFGSLCVCGVFLLDRLLTLLDSLRPGLFLELGLSADWGEEFIKVIRTLEPESYDPANLAEDIRTWFLGVLLVGSLETSTILGFYMNQSSLLINKKGVRRGSEVSQGLPGKGLCSRT